MTNNYIYGLMLIWMAKAIAPIVAASFFFFVKKEKDIADSGIKLLKTLLYNNFFLKESVSSGSIFSRVEFEGVVPFFN
ncbi:MAG: hypothetical protein DI529_17320, partial [Chryseobacterium sp.]